MSDKHTMLVLFMNSRPAEETNAVVWQRGIVNIAEGHDDMTV